MRDGRIAALAGSEEERIPTDEMNDVLAERIASTDMRSPLRPGARANPVSAGA